MTISFWSRPNHYGQVQINLVRPKPFWTDQNCFGHIEGQGISLPHRPNFSDIFDLCLHWVSVVRDLVDLIHKCFWSLSFTVRIFSNYEIGMDTLDNQFHEQQNFWNELNLLNGSSLTFNANSWYEFSWQKCIFLIYFWPFSKRMLLIWILINCIGDVLKLLALTEKVTQWSTLVLEGVCV